MYSTSRARKSGPIWLATAPMRGQATNVYANSAQLGSWTVTTSPGPTPSRASAAAVRPTRSASSRSVTRRSRSTTATRSPWVAARRARTSSRISGPQWPAAVQRWAVAGVSRVSNAIAALGARAAAPDAEAPVQRAPARAGRRPPIDCQQAAVPGGVPAPQAVADRPHARRVAARAVAEHGVGRHHGAGVDHRADGDQRALADGGVEHHRVGADHRTVAHHAVVEDRAVPDHAGTPQGHA